MPGKPSNITLQRNRVKMMAEKTTRELDTKRVHYDEKHWSLLASLRREAVEVMRPLQKRGLESMIHGSVSRGDVGRESDVDIIVTSVVPSHQVETSLLMDGWQIASRLIAQATPSHAPKAHIYLDSEERRCVTFPLIPFRSLELEFYKFGGLTDLAGLLQNKRVAGCTKRLTLIEPTPEGHLETPVFGNETYVARRVGVSPDILRERVRVLSRRDEIGRTGIFLLARLGPDESFEGTLKHLIDSNPAVRRVCRERAA